MSFSVQSSVVLSDKGMLQNNNLHTNTEDTVLQTCQIADCYGFTFYDSMITTEALESNCNLLYSEELNYTDGLLMEN
ncbi:hypothetical protein BW716_24630 [[Flexibacter] sp. ATCC 35208]|nr:hypothetical protein BW716_24630 [[Flexibacter] sp. ATCC 35208]